MKSSLARKLKGRRSITKRSSAASIQNTLSTDSSYTSELEIKSPLHLPNKGIMKASSCYGLEQAPRRSRTESMERAQSAFISKKGSSDTGDYSAIAQSSSGESSTRRSRRFFGPKVDSSYQSMNGSCENNGASAAAAAATKTPPRRIIKEDHEIYAPPGSHSSPGKLKFQDAKANKEKRKRDLRAQRLAQKHADSPCKPPPQLSGITSAKSVASNGTPKKMSMANAKELATQREAERVAKAATALDNRGNEFFEKGHYDKAMAAYSRALKLKRRTFHSMLEEADNLFDENFQNNKLDTSDVDPELLVSMATSINNIGYLRQRAGEATPDETMAAYNKSLRIKRKLLGNGSLSVGKTLNNIASVHYLKKDFEGALPAYKEALEIMQSNLGQEHPDVATVMSNMGDACFALKSKEESIELYRTALSIRWNCFGEKDPRTMRLLEKIARSEIGDRMPTRPGTKGKHKVTDWEEAELYDLDLQPISYELRLLKTELQEDLARVDLLEKKMALGMVEANVAIWQGTQTLLEAQDADSSSSNFAGLAISKESSIQEDDSTRGSDEFENSVSSRSSLQNGTGYLRTAIYSPQQHHSMLSSLQPDEIQQAADGIKSALKLKKGIDTLRDFEPSEESQGMNRLVHATWLGEVES